MSAVVESSDIPATWQLVPLKELGVWSGGGTPSKAKPEYWTNGSIPWVSPKDMKAERIVDSEDHITKVAVEESTAKLIPEGSILVVTRSGILSHSLPVAITTVPVTVNQDLKAIIPKEGVLSEYVAWALRCFAREILNTCSKQGTTVASIETAALHHFEIPVAPLDQQKHIVAEIEKQFSRLDEAVANLKRVKANLKRYKVAVLKAAVEGRLVETEAELARREGRSYENGAELLQRILETRRSQWQGKSKYKEPAAPDTTDLPELPEGWVWVSVEQITTEMMNGYGKRSQAGGFPQVVLRLADIVDGEISLADVRKINCTDDEVTKYALQVHDLLVLRVNGSPDLVGRFVFVHHSPVVMLYCDHFIRARCVTSDLAIWLRAYSDVERCRRYIDLNKVSSAGQNTINQGVLSRLAIPLPPVSEQHRIVAEVDRRLSLLRKTEAQVSANLQRAERLLQSILKSAFSKPSLKVSGHVNG